ncbi:MAG: HXXEE domain-containing protein [Myxococcota bacterium]
MPLSTALLSRFQVTFAFLVMSFAMLWTPLGQHAFLFENWMKLGTFMAPFLLLVAAACRQDASKRHWAKDPTVLSLLMLVAYIMHQFEEHWIDLYGNNYAFHGSVNRLLREVVSTESDVLTPASIFVINTSLVWLVGALAIWRSARHLFPMLAMAAIVVVNGLVHIVLGVLKLSYNPGLFTSVVVFLPAGGYVLRSAVQNGLCSLQHIWASIAWAVLAHILMFAGLIAGNGMGLFPEISYFIALIGWSIVPALIFRESSGRSAAHGSLDVAHSG